MNNIEQLKQTLTNEIKNCISVKEIENVKVKYLGKSGEVTALLKAVKDIPVSEKAAYGKNVNDLRVYAENLISEKESALAVLEREAKYKAESIDITLPSKFNKIGALHPLNIVKNQIERIFTGLGFEVYEGPEIETDYYSFQALNIPKNHPARDMQDTFYITENIVLRPHTSPAQVRAMEKKKPPIRLICPGKTYRSDDDATHSPMFHQIEGLAVDKKITLCDLKGILDEFAKEMFSSETKTRLRPSYFPFTEPSVEVDVSCSECKGKGCRLCKGTGWIEILGAGMVNRRVLENCGVDPDVYSGFAFGMGIERVTMIKYAIPDMRLLFENDLRFLSQFKG